MRDAKPASASALARKSVWINNDCITTFLSTRNVNTAVQKNSGREAQGRLPVRQCFVNVHVHTTMVVATINNGTFPTAQTYDKISLPVNIGQRRKKGKACGMSNDTSNGFQKPAHTLTSSSICKIQHPRTLQSPRP